MKLIFLMALVAFASAADKKEPELTNPAQPDETNVIFNCPTDKPKGFCVRRTKDGYSGVLYAFSSDVHQPPQHYMS